jgi:DNA-binding NarL/FixJ family response regulator
LLWQSLDQLGAITKQGTFVLAAVIALAGAITMLYRHPGAMSSLIRDYVRQARQGETIREDPLTPREQEVIKLIAESQSTQQIADALIISEKTVERHRANILEKFGMHDRVELTRYAIRNGLVEP